jgi:hypothetical protein
MPSAKQNKSVNEKNIYKIKIFGARPRKYSIIIVDDLPHQIIDCAIAINS